MSPNEIPGKGLGNLPDKRQKGVCQNCRRSYRKVKVKDEGNGKIIHQCPHCKETVKTIINSN